MRHILLSSVGILPLMMLAAMPASAAAQSAEGNQAPLAESGQDDGAIVVTARRASESLIDVPVQVSVQSGEELNRTNSNDLPKISETIPFVTIGKQTSGNGGGFVIRGVGNFSGDVGVKQTVLLNLDNVFVGRAKIINQGMYDIAQVEVLKGPQALFFGKNSPAGVVSIITRDPGADFEGYARAGYEFEADERYLEGAVSIPVTDTFGLRIAGRVSGMEGYLKNNASGYAVHPLYAANPARFPFLADAPVPAPDTRRTPGSNEISTRVTALWRPTPDLSLKLKYAYGKAKGNGDGNTTELTCRPGVTVISTGGIPDPQNDCKLDEKMVFGAFPPGMTVGMPYGNGGQPFSSTQSHLVSLNIDYDAGNFAFSSITGYYDLKYRGAQNSFFDSLGTLWNPQTEDSTGFSQEIRVSSDFDGPLNFVMGGYFGKTTQKNRTFAHILLLGFPYDPVAGTYDTYHRLINQNSTTYSGFAQGRWNILENLELNVGARYTSEKNTDLNGNSYVNPVGGGAPLFLRPAGDYFDRERTYTDWSPEATVTWHPGTNQTVYAAYKTGFKSGGFSAPPVLSTAFTDADTSFAPETVKGFEVGYKGRVLDNKVTLQMTAYRYTYSNQQVTIFVPSSLGFLVRNAARSRVQGVELQASYRPTAELTLNTAFGFNDAYYIDYQGAACWAGQTAADGCVPFNGGTAQDLSGRTLPRSPKWAGNFGFVYETPIGEGFDLTLSGNGIYSGAFLAQDNLDPFLRQDDFFKFNAAISIATADDKFELSLIGRNLTDKYTIVNSQDKGFGAPGIYAPTMARTREIAIQGTVRF